MTNKTTKSENEESDTVYVPAYHNASEEINAYCSVLDTLNKTRDLCGMQTELANKICARIMELVPEVKKEEVTE